MDFQKSGVFLTRYSTQMEAATPVTNQQTQVEEQPIITGEKAAEPVVENPVQKDETTSAVAASNISSIDGNLSPSSRAGSDRFRCSYVI